MREQERASGRWWRECLMFSGKCTCHLGSTHTLHLGHPDPSSSTWMEVNTPFSWDFPGVPVVKTSPSNAGVVGSILRQGPKIPHDLRPKNQNIKQRQCWNKFNKDFKNGPHQKNLKKNNTPFSWLPGPGQLGAPRTPSPAPRTRSPEGHGWGVRGRGGLPHPDRGPAFLGAPPKTSLCVVLWGSESFHLNHLLLSPQHCWGIWSGYHSFLGEKNEARGEGQLAFSHTVSSGQN